MITRIFKSAITFFNAVNSEFEYWKQIEELQTELDATGDRLSDVVDENYILALENDSLKAENQTLKDELQDMQSAYHSLLYDYYQMMDKHREFKRSLLEFKNVLVNQDV